MLVPAPRSSPRTPATALFWPVCTCDRIESRASVSDGERSCAGCEQDAGPAVSCRVLRGHLLRREMPEIVITLLFWTRQCIKSFRQKHARPGLTKFITK